MDLRKWFTGYLRKLLAIHDTPAAIAGGIAIGLFWGFTPLYGIKTLLCVLFAGLMGCSVLAAVIAVTLHDVLTPVMPFVFRLEYDMGYWLLNNPHQFPSSLHHAQWNLHEWKSWTTFVSVGLPLLVGSLVFATPVAVVSFFMLRPLIERWQKKHPLPTIANKTTSV